MTPPSVCTPKQSTDGERSNRHSSEQNKSHARKRATNTRSNRAEKSGHFMPSCAPPHTPPIPPKLPPPPPSLPPHAFACTQQHPSPSHPSPNHQTCTQVAGAAPQAMAARRKLRPNKQRQQGRQRPPNTPKLGTLARRKTALACSGGISRLARCRARRWPSPRFCRQKYQEYTRKIRSRNKSRGYGSARFAWSKDAINAHPAISQQHATDPLDHEFRKQAPRVTPPPAASRGCSIPHPRRTRCLSLPRQLLLQLSPSVTHGTDFIERAGGAR